MHLILAHEVDDSLLVFLLFSDYYYYDDAHCHGHRYRHRHHYHHHCYCYWHCYCYFCLLLLLLSVLLSALIILLLLSLLLLMFLLLSQLSRRRHRHRHRENACFGYTFCCYSAVHFSLGKKGSFSDIAKSQPIKRSGSQHQCHTISTEHVLNLPGILQYGHH